MSIRSNAVSDQPIEAPASTVQLVSGEEVQRARERAIQFMFDQKYDQRTAADGRLVGIQATLSTNAEGENALHLYDIVDGIVVDPDSAADVFTADPLREMWQTIADEVQARLGFPLEPELFSNMLTVAFLGGTESAELTQLLRSLLKTFQNSDARGLYHFFSSLRFAGDIDCTAMAARAGLVMRSIDCGTEQGARKLAQINGRILGSAAVRSVSAEENRSYGKDNGPLRRHVFKVYLDDHELQGAGLDRGLKNNPVVVANALVPLLVELSLGLRSLTEVIQLKEYPGPGQAARRGEATVRDIVGANLAYLAGHLHSGAWRDGCRYYGSPDAFIAFYSELLHLFPEIEEHFGVEVALQDAILERRESQAEGMADPNSSSNLALRVIAARNLGMFAGEDLSKLIAKQSPSGGFEEFAPLYTLGTSQGTRVHFGSVGQTTAFAIRALSPVRPVPIQRGQLPIFAELAEAAHQAVLEDSQG